jgi:hypothetical protein
MSAARSVLIGIVAFATTVIMIAADAAHTIA